MNDRRIGALVLAAAGLTAAPVARGQVAPPEPLTLRRATQMALVHTPEVAVSRAEADEAASAARQARAEWRPQAFASTTPGYSTGLPVQVAGQVPSAFGFEVRQTLYDPIRRARTFDAVAAASAARGSFESVSAAAARAVAMSYARVWAGQKKVEDARRRVETREAQARRVASLRREGRRTDLDVENTGFQVARAKQKLLEQQGELEIDRLELARMIDWPAGTPLALSEDPLSSLPEPAGADHLAAARAFDPELRAHAEQIDALQHSASLFLRSFHPVVEGEIQYLRLASFNNYDQYFVKFKENNFTVGVSVVLPLWTGGRFGESKTAANARLARAEGERRVRERDLELAVRRAEAESARAAAEVSLAGRALAIAREELRVARALAEEGRGEPDAVEQRDIAVADAEDEEANAAQGILAARARLLELTGGLTGSLLGPSAEPPPPPRTTALN
jgi:outer membrane protein TolC